MFDLPVTYYMETKFGDDAGRRETMERYAAAGAKYIHIVDLEGAKLGTTPNLDTVCRIKEEIGRAHV